MGEIINLNTARKAREKADKEQKASENRSLFGQNKAEKQSNQSTLEKIKKALDGSKLESTPDKPNR